MINDIIISLIQFIDSFVSNSQLLSKLNELSTYLLKYQDYIGTLRQYLGGAYFIFSKEMVTYVLIVGGIIFAISIVGSLLNIISQFIP